MIMNKAKTIIYILACIVMYTIPSFSEELGIGGILLAYIIGVAIGYVIWKKWHITLSVWNVANTMIIKWIEY